MSCDNIIQSISIQQGETLSEAGTASLPAGTWTGATTFIDVAGVSHVLTTTLLAPVSPSLLWSILFVATAAQTALWPVGIGRAGVTFTDSTGIVRKSPLFELIVTQTV
jgi:hypothetical protein